jgi:hypothetical protein
MKIWLFKPKTLSNTEISITVEAFNSPVHFCLKGNNLHNRRSPTCGQRRPCNPCLKGRTTAVAQTNIHTGEKRTNETKIRNLKFPFLYFLLILTGLHHLNRPLKIRGQALPPGSAGVMIFPTSNFPTSFLNCQLSIVHYPLTS